MAKEKKIVKTETTAEAYVVEVIEPKIDTIQQDINQTKLDQKTCLSTIITHNDSLKEAFEEMKQQKAEGKNFVVCSKEEVRRIVKDEVKSSMKETLTGFNMKASIPDTYYEKIDQRLDRMDASMKRPPLMEVHMNLTAKAIFIILAILLSTGIAVYFWFINTPMYLSNQLYQSYYRLNYSAPGNGYHWAYQTAKAGNKAKVKEKIDLSKASEKEYQAYADTLCRLLPAEFIHIYNIQHDKKEKLIDFADSTGIIRSAHFRENGSIRITDDQRMITLEDARKRKDIKWKKVR